MANKAKNINGGDPISLSAEADREGVDLSVKRGKRPTQAEDIKIAPGAGEHINKVHGWLSSIPLFLREVRSEFDKINWPTRKETISMAAAVLAISLFFSAYLGITDIVLSKLVGLFIRRG